MDIFVAGVGTGRHHHRQPEVISKKKNPAIRIVAMEPASSPVLSGGAAGPHMLQGIGAGFVPEILDTDVYDEIVTVENEKAFEYGKELAKTEDSLWESPLVPPSAPPWNRPESRKTKERPSSCCCRTAETGTTPQLYFSNGRKGKET